MKLKMKIENKAMEVQATLAVQAQAKYIKWLMKEEDVDYETAMAIVEYRTDPIEYEYTLGYKLSDPVVILAIFKQAGKNNRRQAAENFAKGLRPEEAEIFWSEVFDEKNATKFKKEYKKAKKERGIKDVETEKTEDGD